MTRLISYSTFLICLYLGGCLSALFPLSSNAMVKQESNNSKTNLHLKYYQQALFYYFQGNYAQALAILNINNLRIGSLEPSAQLFQAGLQIKLGLQEQARQNLIKLSNTQSNVNTTIEDLNKSISVIEAKQKKKAYLASSNQLLVIALLSLAEQYIAQGEHIHAQQTLSKISDISSQYYQQYHILSQLAYWPNTPELIRPISVISEENREKSGAETASSLGYSPYIQLNIALRFIEKKEYKQAKTLLNQIKNRPWKTPEKVFFQKLFSDESSALSTRQKEMQFHEQAINDYARLLLAHLYSQQEDYDRVYVELKNFPQQSPYTETALFLYAFSAQQIKQHTTALTLLTLLHKQYPHSTIGWQSSLLMAKQVVQQKGLEQGWHSYQAVELFYLNTLKKLSDFEYSFSTHTDLLSYSLPKPKLSLAERMDNYFNTSTKADVNTPLKPYQPESIWLKQAMYDPSIVSLYQQLSEVTALIQQSKALQNKSNRLVETINLNISRKARISAAQNSLSQQSFYSAILAKRDVLAAKFSQASNDPLQQGFAFANEQEQGWLNRIEQSKQTLSRILEDDEINNRSRYADYQQRLNRINGVFSWQLNQAFPERAWQHKVQLAAIDKSLHRLTTLQKNVDLLLIESANEQSTSSIDPFIKRQQNEAANINPLITKLTAFKEKLSLKIREKVADFTNQQRSILSQYLLTTRKDMAAVLEKMSMNDEKIEQQLNLDEASTTRLMQ